MRPRLLRRPAFPCTDDTRLRLARAVGVGDALLIDHNNVSIGRARVEDAVSSGRCFTMDVRDGILAADGDSADAADRVANLRRELEGRGYSVVVLRSGQPGRRHLFAAVQDPDLEYFEGRARKLGLDPRVFIRPPLTPHRLALPVTLEHPLDPEEALRRLEGVTSPIPRREVRPRRTTGRRASEDRVRAPRSPQVLIALLSEPVQDVVRSGPAGYRSRSEAIHAVLVQAASRGFTTDEVLDLMSDESLPITEKLMEMDSDKAEAWLLRDWERAQEFVADGVSNIAEYLRVLHGYPWPARGKLRMAYEGVLHVIIRSGQVAPHIAVRTLALVVGCGTAAAQSALAQLTELGLLYASKPTQVTHATQYLPLEQTDTLATTPPTDIMIADFMNRLRYPPGEDLWRQGALNHSARETFLLLLLEGEASACGLARKLPYHKRTVLGHLQRLSEAGFVEEGAAGWQVMGDAGVDFETSAVELHSHGKGRRYAQRFRTERKNFNEFVAKVRAEAAKASPRNGGQALAPAVTKRAVETIKSGE